MEPRQHASVTGLEVLEIAQFFSGPVCGRLLADLGATVTKIEPKGGERLREMGPSIDGSSIAYSFANTGKRIVELDLSRHEGRDELLTLFATSDVVIDNLTAGALDRLGLPDEPAGPRPRRGIRCSIRGSSRRSDAARRRDVDVTIQGRSGMAWVTGDRSGPRRVPVPIIDVSTAAFAALAVVGRLTNAGLEPGWTFRISMLSAAVFLQGPLLLAEALGRPVPQLGGENLFVSPNGCYRASDGFFALACVDDASWRRLCSALGIPEFEAERYRRASERLTSRERVRALVEAASVDRSVHATIECLMAAEVPCAPVLSYRDAVDDPEIRALLVTDLAQPSHSYVRTPLEQFAGE